MNNKIVAILIVAILLVSGGAAYLLVANDPQAKDTEIDLISNNVSMKIFGNANGDHRLDDQDVELIQNYIDGKIGSDDLISVTDKDYKKTYFLADANLDGRVNSEDITFLKSIINRTGDNMNLMDSFGHIVSVPLHIDKIVCDYFCTAELLQLMGVQSKIVAVSNALMVLSDYYLQGVDDKSKLVNFYSRTTPDYEAVAETDPDVWILSEDRIDRSKTNAAVIGLDQLTFNFDNIYESGPVEAALIAGYIFNNTEAAEKYVKWYLDIWNMLYSKTSVLSDDDRPRVFYTGWGGHITDQNNKTLRIFLDNTVCWQAVNLAGGYNIIDDYPGELQKASTPTANVNLGIEWIADQDYDFLFAHCTRYTGSGTVSKLVPDHGYICEDDSEYRAGQESLGDYRLFQCCDPDNMYLTPGDYMNGASGGLLSAILVASVIHPEIFPELDLQEEHQKYINLMGFDYDLSQHGTFFCSNE